MTQPWTWHGGGMESAKRRFGDSGRPWLDLSTGINPHPWPGVHALAIDWHRLPEPEALAELEAAAASTFGLHARHVCAVPGTEIGLRLVGPLLGGPAHCLVPGYRTHGEMIEGTEPLGFAALAQSEATLILANPTNPDGRATDPALLLTLLETRTDGAWLVVDEAFADARPEQSLASHIDDDRRLVIFRSFGKFFGLAGVRLGFVLGPASMIAALRALLGAWPLSSAAIAIGTAAYRDHGWISTARARLRDDAEALDAMLASLGHRAIGSCPLFRLIEVERAMSLFEQLARHSILTRPFTDQPHWLRIGLPPDAPSLARLRLALADG
jgi:cobalamin biosynthetic protein CobC